MISEKKPEVVVITGGTAGVGRATVRKFAMAGAKIGIIARECERLQSTREEAEMIGSKTIALSADVSNAQMVENAAAEIERELGPIDIWVNNAMVSVLSPFKYMNLEEFKRVTDVTYLGCVHGTMAALRRMVPRNRGTIVQVGSTLACHGIPLQSAYCGAKHAVRGFTDSIRKELMHDGSAVHITMVQLPAMNTPHFDWVRSNLGHRPQPLPPIYQPEAGAEAIFWAAHQKRREVYVGTRTVAAIGNRFAPAPDYRSQQTDEPEDPHRPDNLYDTVPGDYEAHGRFDARSRRGSAELWLAKHREKLGWGLLAAGLGGLAGSVAYSRRKRAA